MTVPDATEVDVAIVGGGPSGAALAIELARRGYTTAVVERRAHPTWHASGVFSSPLTRVHLGRLGLTGTEIASLQRPISALDLETDRGARCRIEYTHGFACGFDRVGLEAALLSHARRAGAEIRQASVVRGVRLPTHVGDRAALEVSRTEGAPGAELERSSLLARVVVGADGSSSLVARAAGVQRNHRWLARAAITFQRADPSAAAEGEPMTGRFHFGRGWYVGIAPVPGARVNVGIVVPALDGRGPARIADDMMGTVPGPREAWADAPITDRVTAAGRLEHHVRRAAGPGWLLVGDAIGFLDPLSGEGLLRALVSARLACAAIEGMLCGDRNALQDYDRRVRRRFSGKNVVSWMLQLFLAEPVLFDYVLRRLAARPEQREELTAVLTDRHPPSRVVDPRFVARLVAP